MEDCLSVATPLHTNSASHLKNSAGLPALGIQSGHVKSTKFIVNGDRDVMMSSLVYLIVQSELPSRLFIDL